MNNWAASEGRDHNESDAGLFTEVSYRSIGRCACRMSQNAHAKVMRHPDLIASVFLIIDEVEGRLNYGNG